MINNGKALFLLDLYLKKIVSQGGILADIGTSQRFAKELRSFEHLFANVDYRAYGYMPNNNYGVYNCDGHVDIECLPWADSNIDAVICLEVLEHVKNPFAAAREVVRCLRSGGQALITVPFLTSYHGKLSKENSPRHDEFPDYWRFTHQGLDLMFSGLSYKKIIPLDGPIEVRMKFLNLARMLELNPFRHFLDLLDSPKIGKATSRHLLYGIK